MSEQEEERQEKVEVSLVVSIVIEKSSTGYSSYSNSIPGCIATGETLEETKWRMREALQDHIQMSIDEKEDFLDKVIEESTKRNTEFPALMEKARKIYTEDLKKQVRKGKRKKR